MVELVRASATTSTSLTKSLWVIKSTLEVELGVEVLALALFVVGKIGGVDAGEDGYCG